MSAIEFCKFHGFGNDYIVFEAQDLSNVHSLSDFAVKACHRHTGIGGDGIAVLQRLTDAEADYECRIINPDGSEAEFSGNGTRCAAAYLYYRNLFAGESLRLQTRSGTKNYQLLSRQAQTFWFRAELGEPLGIANHELQMTKDAGVLPIIELNVGNPVAAIFVDDFDRIEWRVIGKEIESHRHFPNRTNVVFVKTVDRDNIEIRIWERGAGETASSGTCSIAAAVASVFAEKTNREIAVHAPGGTTETTWQTTGEMLITGRADLAFRGEWTPEN